MADYSFTTIWQIAAPVAPVWTAITEVERWPRWWRGVEAVVRLRDGDRQGIGAIHRYTWKSKLPYRLSFTMETTRVEPLQRIEGYAQGELQGTGRWTFTETAQGTTVRYDWHVRTTKAWMNLIAPLARPLFVWNHDVVMARGHEGLLKLLAAAPAPAGGR
ncbi:MAG: SRPBCC family protein [Chloroflexaceae bacterium]